MESNKIIGNEWLCRNCNSLVDNSVEQCPHCHASRPEGEANEDSQESNDEVVERDNYSNATPLPKAKYNFREGVLVNSADIILILGLFCTFGAIIAPNFIDVGGVHSRSHLCCDYDFVGSTTHIGRGVAYVAQ